MSNTRVIAMTDFGAEPCRKFILHSNEDGRVSNIISTECSTWNIGAWCSGNFSGVESRRAFASFRICASRNVRARRSKEVFHVEHPKTLIRRVGVEPGSYKQAYRRSRAEA